MIYIVDETCYSQKTISKLQRLLNAKKVSANFWYTRALFQKSLLSTKKSTEICLFTWDNSPFSGELFQQAIEQGILPAENCYFIIINDSQTLHMWKEELEKVIACNFKGWEDYIHIIPSDNDTPLYQLCSTLFKQPDTKH